MPYFISNGQWVAKNMTDEEIIEEIKFIATEVVPLMGTPYDSYMNNRFNDSDPTDKDYDTDNPMEEGCKPRNYDPGRVQGTTVAEARVL